MWTTVYMTQNKNISDKIIELLRNKGILVKLRNMSKDKNVSENECFEILVPESEIDEAHEIIIEAGF